MDKNIYSLLNSTENQDVECERLSEAEVNKIMERFNKDKTRIKPEAKGKRLFVGTFAAAAAAIALVPTSVYAYRHYKAEIAKTAQYQNTVVIEGSGAGSDTDSNGNSKSVYRYDWDAPLMTYEFGWLPEGFEKPENDWHYRNGDEAFAPQFFRLPDNKNTKIDMPWSADCETYKSDGKTAMINYRLSYMNGEPGNYGREIWVSFDDTGYLLRIYITDGISQEDTQNIIDNIKLVPTDEVCFSTYLPWENNYSGYAEYKTKAVDMDKCEVYHTGDTIRYESCLYDDDSYEITLNSAEITDSFKGIHTDSCGNDTDYIELMDENGNIIENTRRWINMGDGVNTLDEVIKEEKIPMHILKLNVTYKNTWDKPNEIIVCPRLIQMINDVPTELQSDSDPDNKYTVRDSIREHHDVANHFSFDSEKKSGKNHIVLEPGESAEVELAFFVADDEIENLYGYFMMSGNEISYAMQHGNCPVFDLRQ